MRSCHIFPNGDFTETSHLGGRADLIELARIFERTCPQVPMRVDHGMTMLGDESRGYNAGYFFLGRKEEVGKAIVEAIHQEGSCCEFMKCDVLDREMVEAVCTTVVEKYG